jgi:CBS domain-containing protein
VPHERRAGGAIVLSFGATDGRDSVVGDRRPVAAKQLRGALAHGHGAQSRLKARTFMARASPRRARQASGKPRRCASWLPSSRIRISPDGAALPEGQSGRMETKHTMNREVTTTRGATVEEAMSSPVIHCSPDTSLRSVGRLMAEHRVHAIFVFDYGDEDDESVSLWGMVSDLDLVAAAGADLGSLTARGSSSTPAVTIGSDDLLVDAARRMAETGSSHLAVLDPETGRPCGVLSTLDVVRCLAGGR